MEVNTYEVTIKLIIDASSEYNAAKKLDTALKEVCKNQDMTAYIYDDMTYLGKRQSF